MRFVVRCVALLFVLAAGAGAAARGDDKAVDGAALLERVRTLEDLRAAGNTPFVLHAQIRATKDNKQALGTYSLTWVAPIRWHEELRVADFSRVRDGVGGGYLQVRSSDSEPEVIFEMDKMLNVAALTRLRSGESIGKTRSRKIDGADLECVQVRSNSGESRDICVDPATGLLVRTANDVNAKQGFDYSGVIVLGSRQFPAYLRSLNAGGFAIEVHVTSLKPFSGDATSLPAPNLAQAEMWGACDDVFPVEEIVQRVSPIYPQRSKQNGEEGTVMIYARIGADGGVSHLAVLTTPSQLLAEASLNAVSQWKYKPLSCGGRPQQSETIISINFTLAEAAVSPYNHGMPSLSRRP